MKISGFIKNSLLDYPGAISSVIFTQGCNMRCGFCHNSDLLTSCSSTNQYFSEQYVLSYLEKASRFIEALVITGGEASLQNDLFDFILKVKQLGLKLKLDTNGTNPELVALLLEQNLLDYIAMDIKSPLQIDEYRRLVGRNFNVNLIDKIKETINIIMQSEIEYEFRTTLIKEFHNYEDINSMFSSVKGADKYVLQTYNPRESLLDEFKLYSPFTLDLIKCNYLALSNNISLLDFR